MMELGTSRRVHYLQHRSRNSHSLPDSWNSRKPRPPSSTGALTLSTALIATSSESSEIEEEEFDEKDWLMVKDEELPDPTAYRRRERTSIDRRSFIYTSWRSSDHVWNARFTNSKVKLWQVFDSALNSSQIKLRSFWQKVEYIIFMILMTHGINA